MHWENYQSLRIPFQESSSFKRRYSITSDIIAYQLCPLQYNMHKVRKYAASMTNQLYYGTIIHQVLDRAHMHFKGVLNPSQKNRIPDEKDIERYFEEVHNALKARRISAGKPVQAQALNILQRFNRIEGPSLYPRVKNTECHLQTDKGDYILHGNVDVLATSQNNPDAVEIWDYKGTNRPSMGDPSFQQYLYQMQVYAELYRRQTGAMPEKAIIYFLNTLSGSPEPTRTPGNAILEVPMNENSVDAAIDNFSQTVREIEESRKSRKWKEPTHTPSQETCVICDQRWRCKSSCTYKKMGKFDSMRYP